MRPKSIQSENVRYCDVGDGVDDSLHSSKDTVENTGGILFRYLLPTYQRSVQPWKRRT